MLHITYVYLVELGMKRTFTVGIRNSRATSRTVQPGFIKN